MLRRAFILAALLLTSSPAFAQTQPAAVASAPQAVMPQKTTATYGDWTVSCYQPQGKPKVCEMEQTASLQGQAGPVSRIAVGRSARGEPVKLVVQLPIAVYLQTPVRVTYDVRDKPIFATLKRCIPTACLADSEVTDEVLGKLRKGDEAGKLEFEDGTRRNIALPFSRKGFAAAYDAVMKD